MHKVLISAILLALSAPILAAGDAARGEKLAAEGYCYTCHGDKGVAPSRNAPSLAGQSPSYLVKVLKEYKVGTLRLDNKSLGMIAITQPMTEEDMADLAAFYAAQTRPASGAASRGAPPASAIACGTCHNAATGAPGMGGTAPGLAGMSALYIKRQLHAYKTGKRSDAMMGGMMGALTEAQIDEIAAYYSSQ